MDMLFAILVARHQSAFIMAAGGVCCEQDFIISQGAIVPNRPLMTFFVILLVIYTGFCTYLFLSQRSIMYFEQPRRLDNMPSFFLQRPDAKIQVSTREHDGPDALIYFGGNAEDVSMSLPDFSERFPDYALYLMHYRGYGASEGKPSEEAIMGDAFALYDEVAKKHSRITLVGRSLGTGVAVHLAARRPVSKMVLIAPFDSIEYVASRAFPYIPVHWLLKDKYESWSYAPDVTAPTLILMAGNDEVVPSESTERLYRFFPKEVATLVVVKDARHNSITHAQSYKDAFTDFLNKP